MISLKDIITPVTETEVLEYLLEVASDVGFRATDWNEGSVQRTLLQIIARTVSDLTATVSEHAKGMHPGLAKGTFADLLGEYFYKLHRQRATSTVGTMQLVSSLAAPSHNWEVGDLLISDSLNDPNANIYEVTGPGEILSGETIEIEVRSVKPGAKANIPSNASLEMVTPLVGVAVSNPAVSGGTWITSAGTDDEKDDRYADRMRGRWERISYSNTEGAYRAWCLEALPALTRLTVRKESDSVRIVGATDVGGISAGQISTIDNYLNGTDGIGRKPLTETVVISSAVVVTTPTVESTVFVKGPYSVGISDKVKKVWQDLFGRLPIGGVFLPGESSGHVLLSDLYKSAKDLQGVVNVSFTSPIGDIPLGPNDIYSPDVNLTIVIVP
jgi:uncharacterized phage protein gp47/JayE